MKRLFIILALTALVMSCEKKDKTPTSEPECSCYKQYQQIGAFGSWSNTTQTTPEPELCSKDGVMVVESSTSRYYYVCQ